MMMKLINIGLGIAIGFYLSLALFSWNVTNHINTEDRTIITEVDSGGPLYKIFVHKYRITFDGLVDDTISDENIRDLREFRINYWSDSAAITHIEGRYRIDTIRIFQESLHDYGSN